ncbi:MAG: hypothetical protein FWH48_10230, partial [Oscillospiraceae bacterium]|nr:hypothetical protein [Oscillospiraceae bacterium]
ASEHYSFYNKSDSLLHSEFGCDGMTNPDKIGRFLSKQHHKVFSMAENPVWRHHGEWWDTLGRERAIFGEFAKDDLLTFVKVSQVIQGDGLRYILDSNRRRKFKNAGSIIWQYNEPYPNISCTSLADYWGDPKLALEYVAQSYRPTNVSLKHESLVYSPGDMFFGEVYAVCDFGKAQAKISVVARDEDGKVIFEKSENVEIGEDEAIKVCEVKFPVGSSPCYHVSLKLDDGKDTICSNYFFLVKGENGYCDINPVVKIYDGQRGKNAQILF